MKNLQRFTFEERQYIFLEWSFDGDAHALDVTSQKEVWLDGQSVLRTESGNVQPVRRVEGRQEERPRELRSESGNMRTVRQRRGKEEIRREEQRLRDVEDQQYRLIMSPVEKKEKETDRLRAEAEQLFVTFPGFRTFVAAVMLDTLLKEQKQDDVSVSEGQHDDSRGLQKRQDSTPG